MCWRNEEICLNKGWCNVCSHGVEDPCDFSQHFVEGFKMKADLFRVLKPVGAIIDGQKHPLLAGWFWSVYGLISMNTYLGENGEPVTLDGRTYYKVIPPEGTEVIIH